MIKQDYIPRLFDEVLEEALKSKGAVLILGPKGCGKSTTCSLKMKSSVNLGLKGRKNIRLAASKIVQSNFLDKSVKPLMIDEWQQIPSLNDEIKDIVDNNEKRGQYILISSYRKVRQNEHIEKERITRKIMRPMTLFESGESNGLVSLKSLKEGIKINATTNKTREDYSFYICRGGWPLSLKNTPEIAIRYVVEFYHDIVNDDIFNFSDLNIKKDVFMAQKIMHAYSMNIGTQCSNNSLIEEVSNNGEHLNKKTLSDYLIALKRLCITEEVKAWIPTLKSNIKVSEKATRQFVDPSIATASIGVSPMMLRSNIKFRALFESLVIRDLRVYCDTIKAKVYHYKDQKNREADAVIKFKDKTWSLIKVVTGNDSEIDDAATKLIKLANDIDEEETGKKSFLLIITTGQNAYQREDGVYVVPLACLRN